MTNAKLQTSNQERKREHEKDKYEIITMYSI